MNGSSILGICSGGGVGDVDEVVDVEVEGMGCCCVGGTEGSTPPPIGGTCTGVDGEVDPLERLDDGRQSVETL